MKKGLCFVLLLIYFVLFCTSCRYSEVYSSDSDYIFETDSQYFFQDFVSSKGYTMAESDTGYFYVSSDKYLHYIEKETMKDIVLCGAPDCLHDKRESNIVNELVQCNAYVNCGLNYQLFYFKQKLYCFNVIFDNIRNIRSLKAGSLCCGSYFIIVLITIF